MSSHDGQTLLSHPAYDLVRDEHRRGSCYLCESPRRWRQETGKQPILDTLKTSLKDKQMLLFLDNFKQVVEAAPITAPNRFDRPVRLIKTTPRYFPATGSGHSPVAFYFFGGHVR